MAMEQHMEAESNGVRIIQRRENTDKKDMMKISSHDKDKEERLG